MNFHKRFVLRAIPAMLLCLTALSVSGQGQSRRAPKERVTAETVTLHDTGFYPSSITRKAGKFMLVVRNVSQIREASLRLTRNAQRVTDVSIRRETADWAGVVDLAPGVYKVVDTINAAREFTLTLTN